MADRTWRRMRRRNRESVELRWLSARIFTARWYPQGIDVGIFRGAHMVAVTWFRQDKKRKHLASRVTLIDPERKRHLDIALTIPDANGTLQPATIHAGGLAWFGDRLLIAATHQGIWEFDLSRITTLTGVDARRVIGRRNTLAVTRTYVHPVSMRCSFIGRTFDDSGTVTDRVVIGEYQRGDAGRIGEFVVPESGAFERVDTFTPAISQMQGVVRWGDRYFVSASDDLRPGTLWSGPRGGLRRSGVLPVGCEDLALDPRERRLWTLGEHPWRRIVEGIPFSRIGL